MQITQIKQIGKSENYRIFLDDNFALVLNAQTIVQNALQVGMNMEKETLEQVQFDSEKILAFDKAIALLGKSAKTQKDMQTYLKDKGYSQMICDHVIEKLKNYRYIDDQAYAVAYVEKVKGQKGKNLIFAYLAQKGIDKQSIQKALEGLEQKQEINILCAKFMKNKDKTQHNKQKLYRHLLAKGFSYDQTSSAVSDYFKGDYDDWN